MYAYPRVNQGSVLGLEESPIPVSAAIRIDADRQYLLADNGSARAEQVYWSPNELRFTVDTPMENLLVINQNYRKEWRVNAGGMIEDHRGLLAVRLPPGRHDVVVKYRPASFRIGANISIVTIVLLALWVFFGSGKIGVSRSTDRADEGDPPQPIVDA